MPKSLRTIFRDRDDFTAGHSLSDQTLAALDASAGLIVICSPTSAKSAYVTEEVRLFKSRHPDRPVIPLIVGGKPGDPDLECFPPSLKFRLHADGKVTDEPVELLAADTREDGDGKRLALAKVIAGLLGISSDDIFRRAERERRRRQRRWIAGLSAVAILLAGLAVWAEINRREAVAQRQEAERNFAVAKQGAKSLIFDIAAALRHQEGMRIQTHKAQDRLDEALKSYREGQDIEERMAEADQGDAGWSSVLFLSHRKIGDVLIAQGDLGAALESFKDMLAIADRLAKLDADNADRQNDVAIAHDRIGFVLVAQGNLDEALESHQEGRIILQGLADAYPGHTLWQHNLAVANNQIGNILALQGKLDEALASYGLGLEIAKRLADLDRTDASRQRELSIVYSKIGDVLMLQSKFAEARKNYDAQLVIAKRLAELDSSNADRQRELAVAYQRIAYAFAGHGDYAEAEKFYRDSFEITERLAKSDSVNTEWQLGLAYAHGSLGAALNAQNK